MSVRAITVQPGVAGSARLDALPGSAVGAGDVVVRALAMGVCGTDAEIVRGEYGAAPPGRDRLVLGHESLGEVVEAPETSTLQAGDLVVGIVRRPDPVPCSPCAAGEWDMCRNGLYTERGIKALDGFGAERFRLEADFSVRLDPGLRDVGVLVEPASVVAKAWDHIDRLTLRTTWRPNRVLVTGAGPIGLLAALLAVQRGYDVHVLDVVTTGPKPDLVRGLGATYHSSSVAEACQDADIVVECTGVGELVFEAMACTAPDAIVCLTGVSSGGRRITVEADALNRELVLENDVVFGSVNANRRHYELGAAALAGADPQWLAGVITRRVALERWQEALTRTEHDVKVVIQFGT